MNNTASNGPKRSTLLAIVVAVAAASALVTALLVNIVKRKSEARDPYVRAVEVTEDTTDPAVWGANWPRQFDSYKLYGDRHAHAFWRSRRQ
jgi:nitrite reductase (cytochrome c-552)